MRNMSVSPEIFTASRTSLETAGSHFQAMPPCKPRCSPYHCTSCFSAEETPQPYLWFKRLMSPRMRLSRGVIRSTFHGSAVPCDSQLWLYLVNLPSRGCCWRPLSFDSHPDSVLLSVRQMSRAFQARCNSTRHRKSAQGKSVQRV